MRMQMKQWYVIHTKEGKERQAMELIQRTVPSELWNHCRILKKEKLFRGEGKLLLSCEKMFPGYLFIETERPEELMDYLKRSKEYPHFVKDEEENLRAINDQDLGFLKNVCGEKLDKPMSLSEVETDEEGNLTHISGVLEKYSGQIVKKRLRKRYVLAQVDLFQRKETVLFGICLAGDEIKIAVIE